MDPLLFAAALRAAADTLEEGAAQTEGTYEGGQRKPVLPGRTKPQRGRGDVAPEDMPLGGAPDAGYSLRTLLNI